MDKRILYVSDLDGTLLNEKSKISDETANILHSLIENEKVMFTIASARTPATAVPLTASLGIQLPMIVMTGAALWDPKQNKYIQTTHLEREKVDIIEEICAQHNVNPFIYSIKNDMLSVYHSDVLTKCEQNFVDERINSPFKHFYLEPKIDSHDSVLIFIYDNFEKLTRVNDLLKERVECQSVCYHDIFSDELGFLEIFAPGVSKDAAIRRLAESVNADSTVVFGDNLNDIPMLKGADMAIAVENAFPEVKAVANEVIGSNIDNSVALWIRDNHSII